VTDGEVPLDMWSLHFRRAGSGGAPDRASRLRPQIQASSRRTTPCRSTLVVLAADEIVMCKHSVLGGIDPQLGDTPAASLLKVVRTEARGGNRRSDLDPRGHRAGGDRSGQAGGNGTVAAHAPNRSGGVLAENLPTGTWTHGCSIWATTAKELGLPVRTDMPNEVLELMSLYAQPVRTQGGAVGYLPARRQKEA
jgi:hypothetical protein